MTDMLTDKDKVYEAVMLLGVETDTQDTTGQILKSSETDELTEEQSSCSFKILWGITIRFHLKHFPRLKSTARSFMSLPEKARL